MPHLDEQELAQYIDALMFDKQGQLPEYILEHVEECFGCKVEIREVLALAQFVRSQSEFDYPPKQ